MRAKGHDVSVRPGRAALATALCFLAMVTPADAGTVTGVIRSIVRKGVPAATAVVYADPIEAAARKAPQRVMLRQRNKTFLPRVLAVQAGSTVEFPNDDDIFHNVFSLSTSTPFDLGLYRSGDTRSRTFTAPGVYRVFCNIHPQMSAFIVVTPSPFVTVASADGRFSLDLPAGRYMLTALSERAEVVSIEITASEGASTAPELTLDESTWAFAQHKNKFGQNYPAAAYRR
jgi:plastocyanin